MAKEKFPVGSKVVFNGYDEDTPQEERMLVEGTVYEVADNTPENESIGISIDNPDFNPKKKESEDNPRTVIVDVFYDEVSPAPEESAKSKAKTKAKPAPVEEEEDDDEDEEEAPPPKSKAKTKAKPAPVEEEEDEDEDEEEEAPAPKSKAKAKTAEAKAAPVAKTKAKAEVKGKGKGKDAAKSKVKAKEVAKPAEEEMVLENEDEEILELIQGTDDLLELAAELIEDSAALDYKMGGVLFHVRSSKVYQSVDKKYAENGGFALYVQEQLNIDYRKAMYLIDIYYKFNLYGIDAAKVQELGWTKCSKIAAVMDGKNAEDLVELAESSSVSELVDAIKESYHTTGATKTGGEKRKRVTFKFRLLDEAGTTVTQILESAQKDLGLKDVSDVFEHIITEWAVEHGVSVTKAKAKTEAKAKAKAKPADVEEDEEEEAPAPKAKAKAKARASA